MDKKRYALSNQQSSMVICHAITSNSMIGKVHIWISSTNTLFLIHSNSWGSRLRRWVQMILSWGSDVWHEHSDSSVESVLMWTYCCTVTFFISFSYFISCLACQLEPSGTYQSFMFVWFVSVCARCVGHIRLIIITIIIIQKKAELLWHDHWFSKYHSW